MKKYLIITTLSLLTITLFAQKRDYIWVNGYVSGSSAPYSNGQTFDFNYSQVHIDSAVRKMSILETNASICDSVGNLLFYTNGIFIADRTNDTMMNGSGLNPSEYTTQSIQSGISGVQTDLILPKPGTNDQYYLFHKTADSLTIIGNLPIYLYYSIIDMSQHNGLGAVVSKNNVLLSDYFLGINMVAVKHANGRDWWIIQTESDSNNYFVFLLTPNGVSLEHVQKIGIPYATTFSNLMFSLDGNRFASSADYDTIEVMDFNRCTGQFSNPVFLPVDYYGFHFIAFSPSGRYLYFDVPDTVYQYDLYASNIAASKTIVAVYDGFEPSLGLKTRFFYPALAPDNKIYIFSVKYMHVINYPDSGGIACNLTQHSISLPNFNSNTPPNQPNYNLRSVDGSPCDSLSGVRDLNNLSSHLEVYPNPSNGIFYMRFSDASEQIKTVSVKDVLGRIIFSTDKNVSQFNLTGQPAGIYFLRTETKNGRIYSVKLLKE